MQWWKVTFPNNGEAIPSKFSSDKSHILPHANLAVFGLFRFKISGDKWQLLHHPQRNFPPLIVQCG
jgi:hypothetical protein